MIPSDNNQSIIIDKSLDLLKIPYSIINNSKLTNFSGKYFQKIYEEALKIEKGEEVNESKVNIIMKKYSFDSIGFEIVYPTNFGEEIGLLGSIDPLGNWKESNILFLTWNKGNIWTGAIPFNQNYFEFEFKFILTDKRKIKKWESGSNRKYSLNAIQNEFDKQLKCNSYEYNEQKKLIKLICKWN